MTRRLFGGFGSLTSQLLGMIVVLQLAVTAALLGYVQWSADQQLRRDRQAYVAELRDDLLAVYGREGPAGLGRTIAARVGTEDWADTVVLLAAADGRPAAGNLRAWPATVPPGQAWREIDLFRTGSDRPEHIGLSTTRLPDGGRLLTGSVLDDELRLRESFDTALAAALLLAVPLALLSALVLGRSLARRLNSVSETTVAVAGGDLSRRVPRDGGGDAFDELAMHVNAMLDQVETLVGELRVITDGLAHDLRSPLTRVQSRLEQAVAAAPEGPATVALEAAQAELTSLLKMLANALQISRAEAGVGAGTPEPLDVAALLADLAELYGPVAEESGVALSVQCPPGLSFVLHRELIAQALVNLLENALRYARGGDRIALAAIPREAGLDLRVADNGPGIPAERRDEARRRFVRLDPARSAPGSGLGLALAEAVAKLHGGRLELADAGPGLVVTLHLPRRAS